MTGLRIISGGQTGADRAALDFALAVGLECGGWCPRGRLAEDGPIAAKYPLQETESSEYPPRTKRNVEDSDATVIFDAPGRKPSRGTALTVKCCAAAGKPYLVLSGFPDVADDVTRLEKFLGETQPSTLNVAGNRESGTPGIYAHVFAVLGSVFVRPPLCTIPVYLPSSDGAFRHFGSATTLAFKGRYFLATAAHVSDGDGHPESLLICTSRERSELVSIPAASVESNMPVSGSRDDDPFDVGIIPLPEDRARELAALGLTFIGCDDLFVPIVNPGDTLLFVGYPEDTQKLCHYLADGSWIEQQPVSVRGFQTSNDESLAIPRLGFSLETHLVMRFRHPENRKAAQESSTPLMPGGMSGGSVWKHSGTEIAFAGIVTKWHQGGHLVAANTRWLISMLEAAIQRA